MATHTSTSSDVFSYAGSVPVSGNYLNEDQLHTISVTDICSSSLSIVGCISILVFAFVKGKVCHVNVQPLFHLAMADFFASLGLLASSVIYHYHRSHLHSVFTVCSYLAGAITAFYVITFFLTAAYSAEVYMRTVNSKKEVRPGNKGPDPVKRNQFEIMYLMYCMSWAIPLAAVIIMVGYYATFYQKLTGHQADLCNSSCIVFFQQGNSRVCGEQAPSLLRWMTIYKYIFLTPLLLVFVFNSVVYAKTISVARDVFRRRGRIGRTENKEILRVKRHAFLYLSIFFICWIPTVLIGIISSVEGSSMNMEKYFVLYLLQAMLSPLQGLLNAIGYGWQRKEFKQLMCPTWEQAGCCGCLGKQPVGETTAILH